MGIVEKVVMKDAEHLLLGAIAQCKIGMNSDMSSEQRLIANGKVAVYAECIAFIIEDSIEDTRAVINLISRDED